MSAPIEEAGERGEGWDEKNEGILANLWQANPPLYNADLKEFKGWALKAEIVKNENLRAMARLSPTDMLRWSYVSSSFTPEAIKRHKI